MATTAVAPHRHGAPADEAPRDALQRRGEGGDLFLLPAFIGFVVFYAYPALRGFYLSFTDFDLLRTPAAGSAWTTTRR